LLFNEGKYDEARKLYEKVLSQDAKNVDAINSIAYCIKFKAGNELPDSIFEQLHALHG
jgi:Tfp pilus assembly protein PilF